MVLLDRIIEWDADHIVCAATSHVDPDNPLAHAGRLAAICGTEYALQAAAVHGALRAGGAKQPAGYAASLRALTLAIDRLDTIAGAIVVTATLAAHEAFGMVYDFTVTSADHTKLLAGRFSIALPR